MTGSHRAKDRRVRWLALLATIALVATGCARGDGATADGEQKVRVAFFAPLANTYVEATLRGMQEAADAKGAEITKFDTGFDASKQFSQVQDAVTQGTFDAFIIIPLDSVGLVPAVEEAIAQDVKVVTTDLILGSDPTTSEPQVEGQSGAVVNPPKDRAERMVQGIVEACKGIEPCQAGFMAGDPSLDFEQEVKKLLDNLGSTNPTIQLKSYQSGHGYVAGPAIGIAQNMLQANPDLNVLSISSDQAAAGAEQAVKDAGKADSVRIVSSGGSCPAVEAVKEGRWFATVIDLPQTEGRVGMEIAIDAVRGDLAEPKGVNPIDTLDRDPYVSQANIEGFTCEWEG
ncbi:sugar ABC transporter substrate-binding protein [Plantactinospora sp. GCM10030261]|uniref:sugar ABC transporter substrate-binding protein n=1 Tax=Plantactinospora sp. GCM10030261 TaxID=3273420 RepID=UPI00361B86FB